MLEGRSVGFPAMLVVGEVQRAPAQSSPHTPLGLVHHTRHALTNTLSLLDLRQCTLMYVARVLLSQLRSGLRSIYWTLNYLVVPYEHHSRQHDPTRTDVVVKCLGNHGAWHEDDEDYDV